MPSVSLYSVGWSKRYALMYTVIYAAATDWDRPSQQKEATGWNGWWRPIVALWAPWSKDMGKGLALYGTWICEGLEVICLNKLLLCFGLLSFTLLYSNYVDFHKAEKQMNNHNVKPFQSTTIQDGQKIEPRGKIAPKRKKTRGYMANGRYEAQEGI